MQLVNLLYAGAIFVSCTGESTGSTAWTARETTCTTGETARCATLGTIQFLHDGARKERSV